MAETQPAETQAAGGQTTTANFGESEYGARLDYTTSKYQDLWAFIAFYVHIVLIIVLGVIWAGMGEEGGTSTPSPTFYTSAPTTPTAPATPTPTFSWQGSGGGGGISATGTDYSGVDLQFSFVGVFVTLVAGLFAGALFAIVWLKLIQMFAESIIKILLFVQIGCWVAVAVVGLAYDAIYLTVIGILFALIFSLYTWCVWSRIPFAGACLSIASTITMAYHGTIWFALLTVLFNFIWTCIWMTTASSYAMNVEGSAIANFLLFISYYWGTNVWRNVSHTTTCGVAATWYFNSGELYNPSRAAFGRTMTTSFGSVCFGSLLVAILQAIRAMLRNSGMKGCLICIIRCIEKAMQYFNAYAFAQVAIYGSPYLTAGRRTWDLFLSRGIAALVNDNLSGLALTCGAVLGLVVSGMMAYFIGISFYPIDDIYHPLYVVHLFLVIVLVIFCAWLGYYVVVIVLLVVASGVVAVFVCFAEDPAALSTNRPDSYAKLTGSKEELLQMAETGQVTQAPA